MTVAEAAKKIGIRTSKLYQLVEARQIAHHRIGARIVFSEDDIASFLAGCRVSAAPAANIPQPPRLKHISLSRGS